MKLYKYVSLDRIDILKNRSIRFTQPLNWNDPFDMLKSVNNPITKYDCTGFLNTKDILMYEIIIADINYLGLSLTENNNNLLMWSHYAENHKGFVIEFNTNSKMFIDHDKSLFKKVKYTTKRPSLLPIDEALRLQYDLNYRDIIHKEEVSKLFTKSI
jgi:hypothetical protein